MKKIFVTGILVFWWMILSAQIQTVNWYFGDNAGISFKNGYPEELPAGSMKTLAGCAAISDKHGNLLFYTNGQKVWNRNNRVMPHGDSIGAGNLINQNSIFIPFPYDSNKYYLFTINGGDSLINSALKINIIDKTADNFLGDIILRDSVIDYNIMFKLTAVQHCNGKDIWLIAHRLNSNRFLSYLLDSTGMGQPQEFSTGSTPGADIGYMKVSPAGDKIAFPVNNGSNLLEIFDFDNRTGIISNPVTITTGINEVYVYGTEFSPDGKYLYLTTGGRLFGLWQYDLSLKTEEKINASAVLITNGNLRALQLAPDGKIYLARENEKYLDQINAPLMKGKDCDYRAKAVYLHNGISRMGLPGFIQSWLYKPSFITTQHCTGDTNSFDFYVHNNIDSVLWSFGDNEYSNNYKPAHYYETEGVYTVLLKQYHCGIFDSATSDVTIFETPQIDLVDDTTLCPSCFIDFDFSDVYDSLLWQDGNREFDYVISKPGIYSVTVWKNGCTAFDTVSIHKSEVNIILPTAFTPNGDGLNDEFKVIRAEGIIDFTMQIYNRWGNPVFSTDNPETGWDGTCNGTVCPPGTYIWKIIFTYTNGITGKTEKRVKTGTVTLVK